MSRGFRMHLEPISASCEDAEGITLLDNDFKHRCRRIKVFWIKGSVNTLS